MFVNRERIVFAEYYNSLLNSVEEGYVNPKTSKLLVLKYGESDYLNGYFRYDFHDDKCLIYPNIYDFYMIKDISFSDGFNDLDIKCDLITLDKFNQPYFFRKNYDPKHNINYSLLKYNQVIELHFNDVVPGEIHLSVLTNDPEVPVMRNVQSGLIDHDYKFPLYVDYVYNPNTGEFVDVVDGESSVPNLSGLLDCLVSWSSVKDNDFNDVLAPVIKYSDRSLKSVYFVNVLEDFSREFIPVFNEDLSVKSVWSLFYNQIKYLIHLLYTSEFSSYVETVTSKFLTNTDSEYHNLRKVYDYPMVEELYDPDNEELVGFDWNVKFKQPFTMGKECLVEADFFDGVIHWNWLDSDGIIESVIVNVMLKELV